MELNYKINTTGKYGVLVARYIQSYEYSNSYNDIHYDLDWLQYLVSNDLDIMQRCCAELFKEYQIIEFKDANCDSPYTAKIVFTTPLLAQAIELKQQYTAREEQSAQEQATKNREWLVTIPTSQVIFKFSAGLRPNLVLSWHETTRYNRPIVFTTIRWSNINNLDDLSEQTDLGYTGYFSIDNYITKNSKIQKKKLHADLKFHEFPEVEIDALADKLLEFKQLITKLDNLHI